MWENNENLGKSVFLGKFYPNLVFLATTFEAEMLESQVQLKRLGFLPSFQ